MTNDLTPQELAELCKRYSLRPTTRSKELPYFQVIRGKAIRTATKALATKSGVVQKQVKLLDTHKLSEQGNVWTFEVLLECKKVQHTAVVSVEATTERAATLKSLS